MWSGLVFSCLLFGSGPLLQGCRPLPHGEADFPDPEAEGFCSTGRPLAGGHRRPKFWSRACGCRLLTGSAGRVMDVTVSEFVGLLVSRLGVLWMPLGLRWRFWGLPPSSSSFVLSSSSPSSHHQQQSSSSSSSSSSSLAISAQFAFFAPSTSSRHHGCQ